ncbi:hypothetical protein LCGC14_2678780, partial [marine sediment metagenome]
MLDDIEFDLALMLTSPEDLEDLIAEYRQILRDADRPLPLNVHFELNVFAPWKRDLVYDLEFE